MERHIHALSIINKNQLGPAGTGSFEAPKLYGQRADIVLRPSINAAARTVNIDRLLDHEFVFKDVLIH